MFFLKTLQTFWLRGHEKKEFIRGCVDRIQATIKVTLSHYQRLDRKHKGKQED